MERMNPTGKLTPFLAVLFFEGLSLSLVYPAMPTLIFSLSESKAQGIAFCTINLFLFPLVFILSSVLASVALDESGRRPLLLWP